ncbi:MAG: helix-turn-helix domain containing protein [Firmicutes bacterium]|nr:helix-turn-helix domain containing protein [Bacillota bacterium]
MTKRAGVDLDSEIGSAADGGATGALDRREQILQAAVRVFGEKGYWRATTADIATECGISQPYVYRFFQAKETLFMAALERSAGVLLQGFDAVVARPSQLIPAITSAYREMTRTRRSEILILVQAQVIDEPIIRDAVRDALGRMHDLVLARFVLAQCPDAERAAHQFMAEAMLCNVAVMLDLPMFADPAGAGMRLKSTAGGDV